jgi:hypothetical protein
MNPFDRHSARANAVAMDSIGATQEVADKLDEIGHRPLR